MFPFFVVNLEVRGGQEAVIATQDIDPVQETGTAQDDLIDPGPVIGGQVVTRTGQVAIGETEGEVETGTGQAGIKTGQTAIKRDPAKIGGKRRAPVAIKKHPRSSRRRKTRWKVNPKWMLEAMVCLRICNQKQK